MDTTKLYLAGVGLILIIILMLLENFFPEREYDSRLKGRAYFTNTALFIFNNLILTTFNITAVYLLAYDNRLHNTFDLLPIWGQAILGVLLLDFFIWLWHLVNHKVDFLWRFHKVHHSEQYLKPLPQYDFIWENC